MDADEDAAVVRQVLAGDQSAYATLVNRYQDTVYSVAYRMCNSHSDAADMAQDAFIAAFKKLHQYKPEYAFGQWVIGICANRTRNLFRSRFRRQQTEQRHYQDTYQEQTTPHRENEHKEAIGEALEHLPLQYRIAVTLRHIEGYSYEEMARMLRIGVSAAKMRVKRGMEHMETYLRTERKSSQ